MYNQVNLYFEQIIKGLDLDKSQKDSLLELLYVCFFRNTLEAMLGFKGNDKNFVNNLLTFFQNEIQTLDVENQKKMQDIIDESNAKSFVQIMENFAANLPEDMKFQVMNNLKEIHE